MAKLPYISPVETDILGLASMTQQLGGGFNFFMISPLPVASAVPPCTQKETSEPISAPNSASFSVLIPNVHKRFKPLSVAAASALPPANPAATGIFFSRVISTPSSTSYKRLISSAAW